LLRIRGSNLMRERNPQVRIGGEPVQVLQASEGELIVAPQAHQLAGTLAVEVLPGRIVETRFDLSAHAPGPPPASACVIEGAS